MDTHRDKTRMRNELVCSFYPALKTKTQAVTWITHFGEAIAFAIS